MRVETGDMRQMPFPHASFDRVVPRAAIHNLPSATDRAQALREIARVVRPGGWVLSLGSLRPGTWVFQRVA